MLKQARWAGLSAAALQIFAALVSAGCSTTATVRGLTDLPGLPPTATGVVIPVGLQAENDPVAADSGCEMVLLKAGGIKTYVIEMPPGSEVLFAELPAGAYAYKEVVCGHIHWDLTFQKWPHFEVFEGKISLISGLTLYLSSSHSLSARLNGREQNRTDALRLEGRVSAETKARLLSGYTGKMIVGGELEKPAQWTKWEVEPPLTKDERSWPTFHACYRGENDVNALWLGQLTMKAEYLKGGFVSVEQEDHWNTFTEQFVKCVKAALEEFHPRAQARLRYKIFL